MDISMEALEREVIAAVREVFARHRGKAPMALPRERVPRIVSVEPLPPFRYRWPNGQEQAFDPAFRVGVEWRGRRHELHYGEEKGGRQAFGRRRRRTVFFVPVGQGRYPIREWVETDAGKDVLASQVVRPEAPRQQYTADEMAAVRRLPHLAEAVVQRLDEILPVHEGPTLYVVCREGKLSAMLKRGGLPEVLRQSDFATMVAHAVWVASLKGKLDGPPVPPDEDRQVVFSYRTDRVEYDDKVREGAPRQVMQVVVGVQIESRHGHGWEAEKVRREIETRVLRPFDMVQTTPEHYRLWIPYLTEAELKVLIKRIQGDGERLAQARECTTVWEIERVDDPEWSE